MTGRLTIERLKEVLSYDPLTGIFRWVKPTSFRVQVGDQAGALNGGYVLITIDGETCGAHRLAVMYVTGILPGGKTDHRNGIRSDNRFMNLRPGTHEQNMQNEQGPRRNNGTGYLGVSQCKATGRFRAFISIKGKSRHLGRFDTAEEAYSAYLSAKREFHEGNTL
jgi:hypothetical protein